MGRFTPAVRVGSSRRPGNGASRGMVIAGDDPRAQNPAYRPSARFEPLEFEGTPSACSMPSAVPFRDVLSLASGGRFSSRMKAGVSPPEPAVSLHSDRNRVGGLHSGRRVALQLPARRRSCGIVVNATLPINFILAKNSGGSPERARGGRTPARAEERLPGPPGGPTTRATPSGPRRTPAGAQPRRPPRSHRRSPAPNAPGGGRKPADPGRRRPTWDRLHRSRAARSAPRR
jgi:hypothetical protein